MLRPKSPHGKWVLMAKLVEVERQSQNLVLLESQGV
jgi:hypothetical protein